MTDVTRVAIVGTSLLSVEVAELFLSKGSRVTFFEPSSIGGAWSSRPVGKSNFSAPRFNNLIFPYSEFQQKLLESYATKFKKLQLPIAEARPDWTPPEVNKPPKILAGDFSMAVHRALTLEGVTVVSRRVNQIEVTAANVLVNGQSFDYVVLPQNASVNSVDFRSVLRSAASSYTSQLSHWETNRSEHVRLLFRKERTQSIPLYSEAGDPVFDRFGSLPGNQGCFIGRVRREYKGSPLQTLLKDSPHTAPLVTSSSVCDLQTYAQSRLAQAQAERIKKISEGTRLIFLDGIDFLTGVETALERIRLIVHHGSVAQTGTEDASKVAHKMPG
jgi:hypothetical protein